MNTEYGYLPVGINLILYYSIISLIGLLFFIYIRKDKFSIYLFLIFFGGVFSSWGEFIDTSYKIFLLFLTVLLFLDLKNKFNIDIKLVLVFILFSISFWITIYFNKVPFLYSLSQFSKYLIPFLIYFFILNSLTNIELNRYYLNLVLKLILLQVLFSVIKLFTIGFSESVVGSVVYLGGNSATFLPILGLLLIYSLNNGKIKIIDFILLSSMLFISIMSFKRIIWFIYPIVVISLNIIWGRTKYLKYVFLLAPVIFYLGVRLNPSLNKEHKIWGSFDLNFTIQFSEEYSGVKNSAIHTDKSRGRFAGNNQMIKYVGREISYYKTWFGYGPKAIYGINYEDYLRGNWKWGVTEKGSLTGAARFLIAYGLIGVLLYVTLLILFFYKMSNKKLKLFLIIFIVLEFFFYLDSIILPFLIVPLFLISNYLFLLNKNNLLNKLDIYRNELSSSLNNLND